MKWSDKDFRSRVEAHAERRGLTIAELMKRAGLTEDYLRRVPEHGRNIAGILRIAEVLDINPIELMGFKLPPRSERRVLMTFAHIVSQQNFNLVRNNGVAMSDIEKIVMATLAVLKESETPKSKSKVQAKPPIAG